MSTSEDEPPNGYIEPVTAWCVEYVDPRQPGEGSFQVGAFTTEAEADKLLRRMETEGVFADLRINLIPVHHRIGTGGVRPVRSGSSRDQ